MLPFTKQIQLATHSASGGVARHAGTDIPTLEHNETSFPALVARVQHTIQFLHTIKPDQVNGTEDKTISWPSRRAPRRCPDTPT